MSVQEDLRRRLQEFDGRAMSLLGEAEAALGGEPAYVDALVSLVADPEPFVGSGATWLLKSFFEKGGALSSEQTQALIAALPQEEKGAHWSTALHLCQSMRYLDLRGLGPTSLGSSPPWSTSLWLWVEPLLTHKRPFLRAWSLDALAHLAKADEGYQMDFEAALKRASEDEAASVRARARACSANQV